MKRIADGVEYGSSEHARLLSDIRKEMEAGHYGEGLAPSIWEMPKRYGDFAYTAPRGSFWHL